MGEIALLIGVIILLAFLISLPAYFNILVAFVAEHFLEPFTRWFQRVFFGIDRIRAGSETLFHSKATAGKFSPGDDGGFVGSVFVEGERWSARSTSFIEEGDVVSVVDREDLTLTVEIAESGSRQPSAP